MLEGKECVRCVQTLSIDHRTKVNQGLQAHSPETEEQSSLSHCLFSLVWFWPDLVNREAREAGGSEEAKSKNGLEYKIWPIKKKA